MGTGYVRNDTANNIANGNVINADDIDGEFNAIEATFNNSSGHTHDGTTSEGAPIEVIGPSQDIVATASLLRPKTNNAVDLGTTSLKYKDLHMAGTAAIATNATVGGTLGVTGATTLSDTLAVTGNQTNTGNLTVNGNTTLGNAASDTVTVTADVASNLIPSVDNTYDLGASGSEWKDLYIDGTANIDTGSIDTANVGTLAVANNATVTGNLTVDGTINASISGVSTTANALTTPRTITIAGITSGAANFDGSTNITITTSGLTLGGTAVTSTGAELNILDGVTATTTELNILDGITASTAELNILDGVTASTAELNYVDGVTSAIQTQLDAKATVSNPTFTTGITSPQVDITGQGDLRLQDSAGGQYVALQAPATLSSNYTLTLPTTDGTADQLLKTDGSGGLDWVDDDLTGAYEILNETNLNGATTATFTVGTDYEYILEIYHLAVDNDSGGAVNIDYSTDGGSSFGQTIYYGINRSDYNNYTWYKTSGSSNAQAPITYSNVPPYNYVNKFTQAHGVYRWHQMSGAYGTGYVMWNGISNAHGASNNAIEIAQHTVDTTSSINTLRFSTNASFGLYGFIRVMRRKT